MTAIEDTQAVELNEAEIRKQLKLLTGDEVFRASKRSIAFLTYVVEETLRGAGEHLKERSIGTEVFGRTCSYDTNLDHVVRTAATELRKRLAIYYGEEKHRSELRIVMVPGSYAPRFFPATSNESSHAPLGLASVAAQSLPAEDSAGLKRKEERSRTIFQRRVGWWAGALAVALLGIVISVFLQQRRQTPEYLFWKPLLDSPGPVLLAVGDVPNGPPLSNGEDSAPAILHSESSRAVPFADTVTIAEVVGILQSHDKKVMIRRETASSFSDLREGPVVLVGAFNNEWTLRLTRQLRYTLALDAENHLIYIRDAKNPASRQWKWLTNQPTNVMAGAGAPVLHDYALISRVHNAETGQAMVVIGVLFTYGTQAAGEFLTDPKLLQGVARTVNLGDSEHSLQIVLGTTVTDGTPGPPQLLAISEE